MQAITTLAPANIAQTEDGSAASLLEHRFVYGPTRSGKSLTGLLAFAEARDNVHRIIYARNRVPQGSEMLAMAPQQKSEPRRSALLLGMMHRIGK